MLSSVSDAHATTPVIRTLRRSWSIYKAPMIMISMSVCRTLVLSPVIVARGSRRDRRRQHFWCLFKLQGAPSAFVRPAPARDRCDAWAADTKAHGAACLSSGRSFGPPARAAGGLQSIKRQRFSCRRFSQPDAFATTISNDFLLIVRHPFACTRLLLRSLSTHAR